MKKKHSLEIKTAIQISRPLHEVFEAIADPAKMSNYFIAYSTGRMEEGKALLWNFPEFEEGVPIRVGKIEEDHSISYTWKSAGGEETQVEITLLPQEGRATLVTVTEKGRENDEAGLAWLKGNTEGWANFLACLKAYVEYGINLRKGAFDFMKKKDLIQP